MKRTKQQILREIRNLKTNEANYTTSVLRADPYSLVAQKMIEKLPNTQIFKGMSFSQIRAYCKKPLMTTLYNSKQQPKDAFGENTAELQAFYDSLAELFPGALKVMEVINDQWNSKAMFHEWELPDGHIAYCPVMETLHGTLDTCGLNLPYTYHKNQPSKVGTSIVANVVHSIDGYCIRYVGEHSNFDFSHIHDEYKSHPNDVDEVRELYKQAFVEVAKHRTLERFCNQDLQIDTTEVLKGLQQATYHLC